DPGPAPEAAWLCRQRDALAEAGTGLDGWLAAWRQSPPPADARLRALAEAWRLTGAEMLAVALACAAETDAMAGRVLAWLQAPVGGARPTLGLLAMLAARFDALAAPADDARSARGAG